MNYELGRALLRLGRPNEAVPVVRAALHGELDGSSLYMARTELHELLAQAFDRAGMRDSGALHYRAVVNAWSALAYASFFAIPSVLCSQSASSRSLPRPRRSPI